MTKLSHICQRLRQRKSSCGTFYFSCIVVFSSQVILGIRNLKHVSIDTSKIFILIAFLIYIQTNNSSGLNEPLLLNENVIVSKKDFFVQFIGDSGQSMCFVCVCVKNP